MALAMALALAWLGEQGEMVGDGPKRKRPLGLGQMAAKKQSGAQHQEEASKRKTKGTDAVEDLSTEMAPAVIHAPPDAPVDANEEEDALIELEIQAKADEMEELEALYDAALLKLIEGHGTTSSDGAALLFRGVIHECDKLVRQVYHASPSNNEDSLARLKPTYYLVYGNALYRSGLLLGTDSHEMDAYLTAAMDQFELGLEKWSEHPEEKNLEALYLAAAFVLLHKASSAPVESSQTLAIKALDYIQKACLLAKDDKEKVEGALALQKYADSRDDECGRLEWNGKAIEMLQEIVGNGTSISGGVILPTRMLTPTLR